MDEQKVITATAAHVQEKLSGEASGHDWWHVYRVWKMAKTIGEQEGVDMFVVELAALLHDIADYKMHGGDDTVGPRVAREWLESQGVPEETVAHVCRIIQEASFKGAQVESSIRTHEGMVVQDADRLDAIGAIGIARTFAYGGTKHREMYDPDRKPEMHDSFERYKNNDSPTINHFYEKLLLLKGLMNTKCARKIAEERHRFMEAFLERFFNEWEGK